jgi:hypothetical protein
MAIRKKSAQKKKTVMKRADVELELSSLKVRALLLEKVVISAYGRAITMGSRPEAEGLRDVASLIGRIAQRLETDLQNSDRWLTALHVDRATALAVLREHVESLKTLVNS